MNEHYHSPSKGEVYRALPEGKGIERASYLTGQEQRLKGDHGIVTYHDLWCFDCSPNRTDIHPISEAEYQEYYKIIEEKKELAQQAYLKSHK